MDRDSRLSIDGVRLQFEAIPGSGAYGAGRPTWVFLHDSLGSIRQWKDFPRRLGEATGLDVFVYDRQGYGGSDPYVGARRAKTYLETEADVLEKVLAERGIGRALLFGHSDGGTIALLAAAKHPGRIAGMVVEAGHVFIEEVTLAGIRDALQAFLSSDLRERLSKYHGDKVDALFEAWSGTWLSEDFRKWNIERFLPSIRCPVLVIQGDRDGYGSERQVDAVVGQVGGPARKLMLPGIGHAPHREAPDDCLAAAADFVRGLGLPG
jgi:pimeloyl-ACP methyl ester carboxylesterase